MIILGIDPGGDTCGWAAVAPLAGGGKVTFLAAGTVASTYKAFRDLVVDVTTKCGEPAIAVEQPAGFIHDPFRGPHLLATATIAGGIAWMAEHWGMPLVRLPATEVRRMLVGKTRLGGKSKKGDMDKIVAMALPGVVENMPPRTNVHVRDALALAVAAHWSNLNARKSA